MLNYQPQRRSPPSRDPRVPPIEPPRRSGANDNRRQRIRVPTNLGRLGRYGRTALRLNPYLRLAGDALNILEFLSAGQEEGFQNVGAWSKYAQCNSPDITYTGAMGRGGMSAAVMSVTLGNLASGCLVGQATNDVGDPWQDVTSSRYSVTFGKTKIIAGSPRMQIQEAWSRPNPSTFTRPDYVLAKAAVVLVPPLPQFWPVTANPNLAPPLLAPALAPPVPYRFIPSWKHPNRQTSNGVSQTNPSTVPNDWSVSISASPSSKPAAGHAPTTHSVQPPRGGKEKEQKVKMTRGMVNALQAINAVTEANDFINSLYKALPAQYRPRYKQTEYEKLVLRPDQKALAILKHVDKINWDDAIKFLIENEIEDRFYGSLGRAGGEISKRIGSSYGGGINTLNRLTAKSSYYAERRQRELDGEQ